MLAEFGIIAPKGRHAIQKTIPEALEDAENQLPDLARAILSDSDEHLLNINQRIADQEHCFDMLVSRSHNAQKIMKVAGICPITATAVIASIGSKTDRLSLWCKNLVERRGFKRAIVALVAKNARIIWSLLSNGTEYQPI
ncbi:hypothetical protein KSX29_23475 [Photobacterium ganghwense]|nr:hypothetical protein [Photobacterium ganghwense]